MSQFIPFPTHIHVDPIARVSNIMSEETSLHEAGKVIAIGDKVTFVKVNDILFFDAWGCAKTAEVDGKQYYVVPEDGNIIHGKHESEE